MEKINTKFTKPNKNKKKQNDNRKAAAKFNGVLPQNPKGYRKAPMNQAITFLKMKHNEMLHDYMVALLHPDIAVKESLNARIPSLMGSPSLTWRSNVQLQLTTGSSGAFLIRYLPNMMLQQSDAVGGIYPKTFVFNNTCNGSGTTGVNTMDHDAYYKFPSFGQRYRLVSCMIRVGYNGSVLNQSGKLFACHTFEDRVVMESPTAVSPQVDSYVDRYSSDFSLVRNGLWSDSANITSSADGLESIYAPLDPTSKIYCAVGRPQFDPTTTYPVSGNSLTSYVDTGASPQILFAGQNFPVNTNCITVEIYSIYEVIPDPTLAFITKNEDFSLDTASFEKIAAEVNKQPKVRAANTSSGKQGFFGKAANLLEKVVKSPLTQTVVSSILSAL
jgi:hypothetical protein